MAGISPNGDSPGARFIYRGAGCEGVDALDDIWAKMKWSKALLVMFALTLFWVLSLFAAPLSIAPGTFAFTTGGANTVDHLNLYETPAFNWFAKVIYTVGDAQCHQ